jgi:hypothetical protein
MKTAGSSFQQRINIEQSFDSFVQSYGGTRVQSLFDKDIVEPNADYFFKEANVVSELKCFQRDMSDDFSMIGSLYNKWLDSGTLKQEDFLSTVFGHKKLPDECVSELWNKLSKPIDRVLHKANNQICSTKGLLNVPDANGLLLLCNDGNFGLTHMEYISIISNLLQRKYRDGCIDGFVYFTYNQIAELPGFAYDFTVWVPLYDEDAPLDLANFVDRLGASYYKFMADLTGEPLLYHRKDSLENLISPIEKMRYIPKNLSFRLK